MRTESKLHTSGNAQTSESEEIAAFEKPSHTIGGLVEDIEEPVSHMASVVKEDLTRIKANLGDRVAAAKVSMVEMSDDIARRARQSARATDAYVHAQPWKAVGMVALAGLFLGLLIGRRK